MLKYLKKFTLDILPSLAATIIGAYIVNHYVIPASAPKIPAATSAMVDSPTDSNGGGKEAFAKGVAEKSAIEKIAEKAAEKTGDGSPDQRRRRAAARGSVKPAAAAPEQTASLPETPADERRDANELARAAIERLRNNNEPPHTASIAPMATPVRNAVPALPAITPVSPHTTDVFNAGTGAVLTPARLPPSTEPTRSADASRPTPPAAIPAGPPLDLQSETVVTGRTTVAEDVMSAAKSVFHAVLPR